MWLTVWTNEQWNIFLSLCVLLLFYRFWLFFPPFPLFLFLVFPPSFTYIFNCNTDQPPPTHKVVESWNSHFPWGAFCWPSAASWHKNAFFKRLRWGVSYREIISFFFLTSTEKSFLWPKKKSTCSNVMLMTICCTKFLLNRELEKYQF